MDVEKYAQIVSAVVTIATIVTAVTPSKADNRWLNIFLKALNMFAGNVGRNKNADDI